MPSARNELKTLTEENAERVARHMAMAAQVIHDDPELAHEHAQAAMRHAGRVGVVRETLAITAYATGDFALALRELRTVRRITGRNEHAAMIVDSERGVGRPEKALEEGRGVNREDLPVDQRVELAIALSGARLDLGQTELALHELDIPEDDPNRAFDWSAGLFAARAAVLSDLGRDDEAAEWAHRAEVAGDAVASLRAEGDTVVIEEIYIPSLADEGSDEPVANESDDASSDEDLADDAIVDAVPVDDATTDVFAPEPLAVDVDVDDVTVADLPLAEGTEVDALADDNSAPEAGAIDEVVAAPVVADPADESAADEAPAADSPADAPADAPAVDSPAVDSPAVDSPAVDSPAVDVPPVEVPPVDAPAVDSPVDVPAVDDVISAHAPADADDSDGADDAGASDAPESDASTEEISPDDVVIDDQSIEDEVAELLAGAGITDDDEDGAGESDEKN